MSSRPKPTPRKPKAAKEAEKQSKQLPTSAMLKNIGKAVVWLTVAGIASPVSQLNLSPVFGSIPASLHHQRAITITAALALIGKGTLKKYLPANIATYIAVIAYWTPVAQFWMFNFSSQLGIEYGPLAIEAVTYLPLLLLSAFTAADLLDCLNLAQYNINPTIADAITPVGSYFAISSIAKIAASVIPNYIGTHVLFSRIGLQMLLGSISAALAPSRVILTAWLAIAHTLVANPHYPSESGLRNANATMFFRHNYTLLARQESLTGYVSVLESVNENSFRLMRCDHSLLGGEWMVTPYAAERGQTQRETIFSVFVLLEAVRLVKDVEKVAPVPDTEKSALVIGLGIGTAPNALISQGINTTIVELDPVVHHYATKYFGLQRNHTAVIDDAITYVGSKSVTNPGSFNYIIHDVFTGGAEPVYLFTEDFFLGLSALLTDNGVVAINYAGDLSLPSTRLVLNTIHSVFPACRLFRDQPRPETWKAGDSDFINMVVFCVKNDHGKGNKAIRFRQADDGDFRGSIARRNFLRPRDEYEIKFEYVKREDGGPVMGMGDVGELEKWHRQGAVSHWKIMRTVLPDGVWEMW
ncbi:S-adenosyl-L-methionine-dependent methyltransferase [Amniculicola lignicola CBS 123094]|uniref:S-adenosyl-L-methionine-dependent methyltransferase n=1 Tax=Amniculicola lignicola CBS 123094 TaxID=1392246 RepID=A0A6A5VXZ8_9PLEO|nr:S-adenosyl-L-methionine-dependent methyltransferase [Amniculicola lignicola CBS 123094]